MKFDEVMKLADKIEGPIPDPCQRFREAIRGDDVPEYITVFTPVPGREGEFTSTYVRRFGTDGRLGACEDC